MKNKLLVFALLFIGSISLKAQEKINLMLSFRPTIATSSVKNEPNDKPINYIYQVRSNKQTSLNFNLSLEMQTKKDFYHFPVVGFSYLSSIRKTDQLYNDKIVGDNKYHLRRINLSVGYGVGKYIYVYKESLFLNLKNSINLGSGIAYSSNIDVNFDTTGVKTYKSESWLNSPITYSIFYELNPSIGYKLKQFSLSLGLPLVFDLDIVNGIEKQTNSSKDYINNASSYNEKIEQKISTSFNFRYGLELSLRYHFKNKKKLKMEEHNM